MTATFPVLLQHHTAIMQHEGGKLRITSKLPLPNLEPDQILVKTAAAALNPCDYRIAAEFPTPGTYDGNDFSSTVVACGAMIAADGSFKPNDRVFGAVYGSNPVDKDSGSFAECVKSIAVFTWKIPDWMSFEEAAGMSRSWIATMGVAIFRSLELTWNAAQSLRSGESPLATAAGANLLLGPAEYVADSNLKMLSPNEKPRMFDEAADGYARGEGFAVVVLKTLSAAVAARNHIECIIRETGFNQDGRTKGIRIPSLIAQAALIRDTYARAGLDLSKASDRPQYFEAYGTGKPAGDPVEAEAIDTAFYDSQFGLQRGWQDHKLLVGSINTVIGHTEGTAGLASLLKASLALQHGEIAPNLHLKRLNPAVKPFYSNSEIPTSFQPLAKLADGAVKRASVNSFRFGGANAHAVLKAYEDQRDAGKSSATILSPFIFAASSDRALSATLKSHADYLQAHPDINLRDVAYILHSRCSILLKRATLSATSLESSYNKLQSEANSESKQFISTRPPATKPRILGVFTGQGAQWARMGVELVETSPAARQVLEDLENSLMTLPPPDRPSWSTISELLEKKELSRLGQAEISQPLCTAFQIMLVIILRSAGVIFDAVVGHSSGEIGAAYAAGIISASDAIRVAYHRGFHMHLGQRPGGKQGAIMATGTTFEDAEELCQVDDFEGRLCVAASNSSNSVTISGDADAIEEAKEALTAEGKFAR